LPLTSKAKKYRLQEVFPLWYNIRFTTSNVFLSG